MPYINAGAYVNGLRPKSKTALKAAIVAGDEVVFDKTSAFDGAGSLTPHNIPHGIVVSVVGPDPYTSRKWYANITRTLDGKVKVS
jgi:hypothetical protein